MTQHPLPSFKLIIFDLDGSLRYCIAHHGPCHNAPHQWSLYADVPAVLAQYDWQQVALGVATNQAAIGLGFLDAATVYAEAIKTLQAALPLEQQPPSIHLKICPHRPDAGCECRKPSPGMLQWCMVETQTLPEATLFVGDSLEDAQAADRAGCVFIAAWEFFGRAKPSWATWTQAEREAAYRRVTATGETL